MVPTLRLVEEIVNTVAVPVIASGGLMDGRDIAAAMARGASAAQLGTAFLACPESGASEAYKRAILDALTRPMRSAAAKSGNADFLSLWAGTGVARARTLPAGELVRRLVEETAIA
jgi:nitronate monooxygenase